MGRCSNFGVQRVDDHAIFSTAAYRSQSVEYAGRYGWFVPAIDGISLSAEVSVEEPAAGDDQKLIERGMANADGNRRENNAERDRDSGQVYKEKRHKNFVNCRINAFKYSELLNS